MQNRWFNHDDGAWFSVQSPFRSGRLVGRRMMRSVGSCAVASANFAALLAMVRVQPKLIVPDLWLAAGGIALQRHIADDRQSVVVVQIVQVALGGGGHGVHVDVVVGGGAVAEFPFDNHQIVWIVVVPFLLFSNVVFGQDADTGNVCKFFGSKIFRIDGNVGCRHMGCV